MDLRLSRKHAAYGAGEGYRGWSDDQRDRYAERLYEQEMAAV